MEVDDIISYRDLSDGGELRSGHCLALVIVDLCALVFNRARWRIPAQSR